MPISDWTVSATLASVYGDLVLNAATGDRYLIDQSDSDMWQDVRAQQLNVPQEDGSLIQERFFTGTRLKLAIQLWENGDPACDEALTRMVDTLMKHAASLLKAANSGRFLWDPAGDDVRMLDYMQLLARPQWAWADGARKATLNFDSPFPYAIDFTQILTNITGSTALDNVGNTTMFPVFKVNGASSAFTLSNDTTGLLISFDSALPGASAIPGGSYLEIDTFRNTAYLNGDGANYKPGIDVQASDFFGLVPGANVISISGAPSVDVLWQAAWV